MTLAEAFDTDRFRELLRARSLHLGEPLIHATSTASTNDDALRAARAGAPDGATFVADYQSHGRGRRGRDWFAEPCTSLLASVVLRRALRPETAPTLSLTAGLAVRCAIARALPAAPLSEGALVKWPNDVWVSGRKIAGILAESQIEAGKLSAIVIGFGINVSTSKFPEELAASVTSLTLASSATSREALLVDVLDELERRVTELERFGFATLRAEFARYDALAGRRIRVDELRGVASGIDEEGRLLVERSPSELVAVSAGTLELDAVSARDTLA